MRRGEIWWAALGAPIGSGPGYRRPILVVSSNVFNDSRISTVIVAVITSNLRLAIAPGNVLVQPQDTGLPRQSVVNISQLLTIDKGLLTERVGHLPADRLEEVEAGLLKVLDL
ncbi:MAG: type II toxin-antitoxin system PemK/MazF family toxin [Deltaproteobacteria bacterium]|nr:type II toxin-antitoxin system PemK/MazF family toxin [Deltaproteobacteria bacterium]MBW2257002.1 type II toxin-antitoxin system PemK/MazF family toxin [Deltaproteobacteria bacterium]